MPMVSMPLLLAMEAITGAAPVPVPPPMPAVMKHKWVLSSNSELICSFVFSASLRPNSGLAPAPSPLCPSNIFTGTGELARL